MAGNQIAAQFKRAILSIGGAFGEGQVSATLKRKTSDRPGVCPYRLHGSRRMASRSYGVK